MRIIDHKPALFEKSGHNIWTDPYIQQQILKDHLDPQSDDSGFHTPTHKAQKSFA